jgi:hypothetical protein
VRLSRADFSALRQAIEQAAPPGHDRDMLVLRHLFGRKNMSRREFVEMALPIKDKKTQQLIPTNWNRAQRYVESLRLRTQRAGKQERYATLKARQFGMSRFWLQSGIEFVLRDTTVPALIIADDESNAKKLLEDGKIMCSRLPFKVPRKYENRSQLYFGEPILGYIDIETAQSTDPARSRTYRFVHATEPGTWKDPESKIASLNQAVPTAPGTVLSYEGTARGRSGWWYEFWWAALEKRNDYQAVFFPWWFDRSFDYADPLQPGDHEAIAATLDDEEQALLRMGLDFGQLKWRRACIRNNLFGDIDLFHQEYPSTPEEAFLTTGRPCFPPQQVLRALRGCTEPAWRGDILLGEIDPVREERSYTLAFNERGSLKLWAHPQRGRMYCITADPGDGLDGGDFSAAQVIDMETAHQVGEFNARVPPFKFGKLLAALGRHFNGAYLMPEIERNGIAVLEALREENYHMIGRRAVFDSAGRVVGRKLGWSTNVKSRPLVFNAIRAHLATEDGAQISSIQLCRQMLDMFIDEQGREDHPSGKHDDLVLAWGIALMARKDAVEAGVLEDNKPVPRTSDERHWAEFHAAVEAAEKGLDYDQDEDSP